MGELELSKKLLDKKFALGNSKIDWVQSFTYLGVIIDETLKFNLAIEQMHRKAAFRLKQFNFIRKNLTTYSALVMAKSLILPYLDYGNFLLSSCPDTQLKALQLIQNKALKTAMAVPRLFNTKTLHHRCNTLLVKDKILHQQLKLIHRSILLGIDTFPIKLNTHTTRTSDTIQLSLTTPCTELFRKSICYFGISEYNRLPVELKNLPMHLFNTRLQKYYLDTYTSD